MPPTQSPPTWNRGRRRTQWYLHQLPQFEARLKAHHKRERELYELYGTKWPGTALKAFVDEQKTLQSLRERFEEDECGPFFPQSVITAIDEALTDVNTEDHPRMLERLCEALRILVDTRTEQRERGVPHLDAGQRARLKKIKHVVGATVCACGPDVEHTQQLIGNWAEAGLLHGLSLVELIDALCTLDMELTMRLSQDVPRDAHRPKDAAFERFCRDVTVCLSKAGEKIRVSRSGSTARVIRALLQAAGQRIPRDLLRHIKTASEARPRVIAQQRELIKKWSMLAEKVQ